jgi:hypothetical protein
MAAHTAVPLPQPRPPVLERQQPTGEPRQVADQGSAAHGSAPSEACLARLRQSGIHFERPVLSLAAGSACAIETPVRLKSITARTRDTTTIRFPDEPVVSCEFAERLADWIGNLVAPMIAGRLSADLNAVHTGPGYECRNRNGLATEKLSAHALGKAVDIAGFGLSSGKSLSFKGGGGDFANHSLDAVRTSACGWFTTVLGPGADAFHTDHMHLDIALHGKNDRYRICE